MKSIKNTTINPISIKYLGLTVQPDEIIEANPQEYNLWVVAANDDVEMLANIFDGKLVVYDDVGAINNYVDAVWHLKRLQTKQEAFRTPFDPLDTDWTNATDAQQAIEDCYRTSIVEGHFSYRKIVQNIIIKENEQMIVYQELCIAEGNELYIIGEVVVLP